jgi:N-acetylmuramic acid 6-phosphate (MurNAc-6-P) etherase
VRLKRVTGNEMTHLLPTNAKLRERAVGIVSRHLHCGKKKARKLLTENGWDVSVLTKRNRPSGKAQKS